MNATAKTNAPTFSFHVPNTPEGQAFIKQVRQYANYGHIERTRIRANGPRVAAAKADGEHPKRYQQDLPRKHATSLRVYIDTRAQPWQVNASRDSAATIERYYQRATRAESVVLAYEAEVAELSKAATELAWQVQRLEHELSAMPKWVRRFFAYFNR